MIILDNYIKKLLEETTPEYPIWNKEQLLQKEEGKWNYVDGCMIKALLELYRITNKVEYLNFADSYIDSYVDDDGNIRTYDIEEYNLDHVNEGKVLFDLLELTGKEKYKKAIFTIMNQIANHPRTESGNFWHKKIYPNQVWLDGLYMVMPFYLAYEKKFNNNLKLSDIYTQFSNVEKNMRDDRTGLYYHAFDESRQMFWCDKQTGLSPNFWIRAVGWFVMALTDTLELMDEKFVDEIKHMKSILKNLIDSLINFQDESGMWYQLINRSDLEENYLETSGSSILAYGILKAVRLGYINKKYTKAGKKAFYGTIDKYLSEEDGQMSLGGICLVAGLGGKKMRDGTVEYYFSEPIVKDEAKGVAPLLLAYTEILRLKN